ncbi:hypothetical protein ACXR2T_10825 [Leucobacter sp. HY1910]
MLKKMITAAAIAIAATVLAGCSQPAPEPAPAPEVQPVEEVEEVEEVEAMPAVSLSTTCRLLFGSNVDGPAPDAIELVNKFVQSPDMSTVSESELGETIDALTTASKSADDSVKPYIEAQSATLQQLLDARTNSENATIDFADFKASGLELLTLCTPHL